MHWIYSIVHGGVVSHEVDNLVWVIFCGFHVGGESASRTLMIKKRINCQTCKHLINLAEKKEHVLHRMTHLPLLFITHSARSWVRDLPSVCHPLVVGPLLVGKRPIEDHTDVGHRVDAHCGAFKHRSGGGRRERVSAQRQQLEDAD